MKKFLCVFVSVLIIFITLYICFYGSYGKSKQYSVTSQIEYNFFNLSTDRYLAECYFGEREEYFEYDGNSTQKVEYGIFRVIMFALSDCTQNLKANIKINNKEKIFILEKNPFDNSFMCDICQICDDNDCIEIIIENIDNNYQKFNCISANWNINYKKAINMSFKYLKEFALKNNNNFEGYLTIVYNKNLTDTLYFWCYRIVTKDNQVKLVVIDTNFGDVVLMSWNIAIILLY